MAGYAGFAGLHPPYVARALKIVIPAKTGLHLSTAGATELWVPAFAGTTVWVAVDSRVTPASEPRP